MIAFAGLFAFMFRDRLVPALQVATERAILTDLSAGQDKKGPPLVGASAKALAAPGELPDFTRPMLFQAAGWLEPDPLPIRATALTDGVVEKVHVLEGQEVRKGQLLAELISEDAELEVAAAESAREAITAEHHMHLAQIPSVEAQAQGILDRIRAAKAHLSELEDTVERLEKLSKGTISASELTRARLAVEAQEAEIDGLGSDHRGALAQLKAIEAQSAVFEAKIAEAAVVEAEKQLALRRTKIVSPVDGFVLELKAAPGQKKMLGMDDPDSATVAVLFEKGLLQARVDVPLADARGLLTGQAALVTTDFLPNVEFRGVVTRIVGAADLQRNTLQAKVRVIDPDPRLRPEMLCRVKFLEAKLGDRAGASVPAEGTKTGAATGGSRGGARQVMVPERALGERNGSSAIAWVIGSNGARVERREVALGRIRREGFVAADSGILAGEQLVLPPHDRLSEGRRVRVQNRNIE